MGLLENYHIDYYNNGIISLLINTHKKWLYYDRRSYYEYEIANDKICETIKISEDELILDKNVKVYVISDTQNKEQIQYFFIPFDLLKKENIINSIYSK
jgi:hypothetical protein